MKTNAMSLKAQIRNMAKENNVPAQVLLQNFMFERFLERLSQSRHKDKFIIKGGVLIAAMVGLDVRSTMDLDATIRGISLSEDVIFEVLEEIAAIVLGDDVSFQVGPAYRIRSDDVYGGYRVPVIAQYEMIEVPLSIDITTGDAITPSPIPFSLGTMLEEDKYISLWAYNVETILAEKIETILRRNVFNTRARDFYDVYILSRKGAVSDMLLQEAIAATAKHRGTTSQIEDREHIIKIIEADDTLQSMWRKYQQQFAYANEVEYEDTILALKKLCQCK